MNVARRRVAVAMSGGVDSSVAAYLVSREASRRRTTDRRVVGVHMSNWDYRQEEPDRRLPECSEQEWKDAQAVARHLGMDIKHVSFTADYWNQVFQPYCDGLSAGIMPNPDVDCNRYIKFGRLREHIADKFGRDTVLATGHYARVWNPNGDHNDAVAMPACLERCFQLEPHTADLLRNTEHPLLLSAVDTAKDQSYFLCGVRQSAFRNVHFPLGEYYKNRPRAHTNGNVVSGDSQNRPRDAAPTVRDIAEEAGLPTASKRESMGICFIGKRTTFGDFVQQYTPEIASEPDARPEHSMPRRGKMVSVEDGSLVATYNVDEDASIVYSTVGQGAKISGLSQRWFIADKLSPFEIVVCPGTHHPSLYVDTLHIARKDMNWLFGIESSFRSDGWSLRAKCRIRHLQPLVDCEVRYDDENFRVTFEKPLRGVAKGQIAAFYVGADGLVCIGGGQITGRGPTYHEQGVPLPEELHPAGHNDLSTKR